MDMGALTLLVEILDAGNLSEAARRLKVSRANVSYHLNQLERAVGAQLMRRNTRRVEPTEIGLRLYEHGRRIQNELLAAKESVTTLGSSLQGRVRLSVPSGYGQIVMSGWLIEFKRMYPGIVLEVLFENRVDDLLVPERGVLNGRLHLSDRLGQPLLRLGRVFQLVVRHGEKQLCLDTAALTLPTSPLHKTVIKPPPMGIVLTRLTLAALTIASLASTLPT